MVCTLIVHLLCIVSNLSIPPVPVILHRYYILAQSNDFISIAFPINRLLTPPETPLFRSLDDEDQSVTQVSRGRAQSKPIQISRSSTVSAYVQRSFFQELYQISSVTYQFYLFYLFSDGQYSKS